MSAAAAVENDDPSSMTIIAVSCRAGLQALAALGILHRTVTTTSGAINITRTPSPSASEITVDAINDTVKGRASSSDSGWCLSAWPSDRVQCDEATGHVTGLNLGGCRLRYLNSYATGTAAATSTSPKEEDNTTASTKTPLETFLQAMHSFQHLACLNLGGTDVSVAVLRLFLAGMKTSTPLDTLALGGNALGNDGATVIGEWLANHRSSTARKKLVHLDLRYNDLTRLDGLCDALNCQSAPAVLHSLHLEGNALSDDGILRLSQTLYNDYPTKKDTTNEDDTIIHTSSNMRQLFLGSNQIGPTGASYLAQALEQPTCGLTKLYLDGNRLGDEGAAALTKALWSKKQQQKRGTMSNNDNSNDDNSNNNKMISLQHLFVDNNGIGKEAAQALGRALSSITRNSDDE